MSRELREFRRLERVCLEQAELSTLDLARIGLLKVAADCRVAAEAIEARSSTRSTAGLIAALKHSFSPARSSRRH
ncbi:hypothetical protein [Bradyrhizobium sp. UFLA05-112]